MNESKATAAPGIDSMKEKLLNLKFTSQHAFLVTLALAICSIVYQNGGVAHPEIYTYLPYYLSDRPLPSIIYDSKSLDMNLYQARELSYFFDYLDCRFIELSVRFGYPHFISITTYVFLITTSMLLWWFSTRYASVPPIIGLLLIILFWTSPSIFLAHSYFRSAKVGVTLLAAILFILIHRLLSGPPLQISPPRWVGIVTLSLAMTLFDRQGVYFVIMAMGFLILWSLFFPTKDVYLFMGALFVSLLLSTFYNHVVGPFLTELFNHYQPNFSYQHLRWEKLFQNLLPYLWAGTILYLDTLRFLLGNIPAEILAAGLFLTVAGVAIKIYREIKITRKLSRFALASLGLILCNVLLLIGLNILMVLRHTPIFDPGVRRVYYWMPEVTLLTLTLAMCLGYLINHMKFSKQILLGVLILAIAGNIYALPEHYTITVNSEMQSSFEYAPQLLKALENINHNQYQPPAAVSQDAIYNFFENEFREK